MYVQYGCGLSATEGWLNFDASPTLVIERTPVLRTLKRKKLFPPSVRYGDIVKGLPIPTESCDGIYCSHVLEHLALHDFWAAIKNTYAYLKPNGIFRLVVPDLREMVMKYLNDTNLNAAITFMDATGMATRKRPRGFDLLKRCFGNSAHLWLWDEPSLLVQLGGKGFEARRAEYGDSEDKRFLEVEDPKRFAGSVAVECRKPHR
jgi:SAM-dependent methyltransferase